MNRPKNIIFIKCNKCKNVLHISKFNKHKNGKYGTRKTCKECEHKYKKEYREKNKDKISEIKKEEYKKNKEIYKMRSRKRYNENKDKDEYKKYKKEYRENNPEKIFNQNNKRRLKEESQGNGITKEQWLEMMEFFNWTCAYSGEYIGGKGNKKRTIDHIVPLDNGGEHDIWNLVPMYKNYNSSKITKDMLSWYLQQEYFDIDRLTKIYEWRIYAYWKYHDYKK